MKDFKGHNDGAGRKVLISCVRLIAFCLFFVLAERLQAQTESVLYSFAGGADGAKPYAGLVRDQQGNLYGTTLNGGGCAACNNGCGTVFKLSPAGTETVLYSFGGNTDGATPYGGVVLDNTGHLFGTTSAGGMFAGTVFEVSPVGVEVLLHTFQGSRVGDGSFAPVGLVRDKKGNLYGTTFSGGTQCSSIGGCGTVFQIDPTGLETVLYSFTGGIDGGFPFASLLRTDKGDFYGTTVFGGSYNQGTIFKLSSTGVETVLYHFTGGADGSQPAAGLVSDNKGNFLGTTTKGGASGNGTVFRISRSGQLTVLYSFQGGIDGSLPSAALVLDNRGNIFGTTNQGGTFGFGTVFEITAGGTEKILYSFTGGADGGLPTSALVLDNKRNLLGTTSSGGTAGFGTVFSVRPR